MTGLEKNKLKGSLYEEFSYILGDAIENHKLTKDQAHAFKHTLIRAAKEIYFETDTDCQYKKDIPFLLDEIQPDPYPSEGPCGEPSVSELRFGDDPSY